MRRGSSRRDFIRSIGAASLTVAAHPLLGKTPEAENRNAGALAGNPIVIGRGMCDPHARVYGNHVYVYATHDAIPGSDRFVMKNWWVWRSRDLRRWECVSILDPRQTYWRKPWNECWATDAIHREGRYYFYFSRGPEEIGVVVSESPHGPWKDPLGKPLIAKGSTPTFARDPGILQEEDGTSYIVFGCWDYYIARLNEDMISLAEKPRLIRLDRKMGPYGPGKTDDKPYLHKRRGKYYLSWGCYYAMADSVYGPYTYKDTIIRKDFVEPVFHKGLTQDRHGSFFELYGQWYFLCNDQSFPGTTAHYRDSVLSYVHYRDNGEIAPIELNRVGVAAYDARALQIPAANYFRGINVEQAESPSGGFEVRNIRNGSRLEYPSVANLRANCSISFHAACANPAGGKIEVRQSSATGRLLGTYSIPSTGDWKTYGTGNCPLKNTAGTVDVCLVFRGNTGELLRLQWISFV